MRIENSNNRLVKGSGRWCSTAAQQPAAWLSQFSTADWCYYYVLSLCNHLFSSHHHLVFTRFSTLYSTILSSAHWFCVGWQRGHGPDEYSLKLPLLRALYRLACMQANKYNVLLCQSVPPPILSPPSVRRRQTHDWQMTLYGEYRSLTICYSWLCLVRS